MSGHISFFTLNISGASVWILFWCIETIQFIKKAHCEMSVSHCKQDKGNCYENFLSCYCCFKCVSSKLRKAVKLCIKEGIYEKHLFWERHTCMVYLLQELLIYYFTKTFKGVLTKTFDTSIKIKVVVNFDA